MQKQGKMFSKQDYGRLRKYYAHFSRIMEGFCMYVFKIKMGYGLDINKNVCFRNLETF